MLFILKRKLLNIEMMNNLSNLLNIGWLKSRITVVDIPIQKIILVILVIILTQILKQLFSAIIIKLIEDFTSKTKTDLDDELIKILKQPLN